VWTGKVYEGEQWVTVLTPLDQIPLFLRGDAHLPIKE
jgi:alpha-glucosidase (family GH31 glycosyl hydrolase)